MVSIKFSKDGRTGVFVLVGVIEGVGETVGCGVGVIVEGSVGEGFGVAVFVG